MLKENHNKKINVCQLHNNGTGSGFDPLLDEVTEKRKSENRKRKDHFAHLGLSWVRIWFIDRDSSVGIATYYGRGGPGIRSRWGGGKIFRTRPDRTWGPPSLLHNGYRVFPVGKWSGCGVDHPPHLAPRLKKE